MGTTLGPGGYQLSQRDFEPALRALLGEAAPLSASAIARVNTQFRAEFDAWKTRRLDHEHYVYTWADGVYSGAGPADEGRVILVVMGADAQGEKHLVALDEAMSESEMSWREILHNLKARGLHIKQLIGGTTLYLPVYVEGANFSTGDGHFAQGDGESCGTAVEMGATLHARFEILEGEAKRREQRAPSYSGTYAHDAVRTQGAKYYATTGSAEENTLATHAVLLSMIAYITDAQGLTRHQAYCLCSVAVDLHMSQIVDMPNYTVSAFLPLGIFQS